MNLKRLGWKEDTNLSLEGNQKLARVTAVFKNKYKIHTGEEELLADLKGNMIHAGLFPAVGDWVIVIDHLILDILTRKSKISRKVAGKTFDEQVIAVNIDYVFIVSSLNQEFNLSRLERYLTMVWESGANPVFLLTKSDISDDFEEKTAQLEAIAYGVPIHVISSLQNIGLEELNKYFENDKTSVFIGSSGVGKSTLINKLIGKEVLVTKEIRENDGRGKHTTTHREMFFLETHGIIIDTPGMREIQLWGGNLKNTFEDIEKLALNCKFRDCTHNEEPGCAVKKAIDTGLLAQKRFQNYKKLKRELEYETLNSRQLEVKKFENMMGSFNESKAMRKFVKNKDKIKNKK